MSKEKTAAVEIAPKGPHCQHDFQHNRVTGADVLTIVSQMVAAFAAVAAGTARPLMTLVFGGLVNLYNGGGDRSELKHKINKNVLYIFIIFLVQWLCICLYGVLFSMGAMRFTMKLRSSYLRAVVSQDIEHVSESRAATDLASNISGVENALSEKLGTMLQAISTMLASLILAFTQSWRLSIAMFFAVLAMLASNLGLATFDAKLQSGIQHVNLRTASLAEECFTGIRTVNACLAHKKMGNRYARILDIAKAKGIRRSFVPATSYGTAYLFVLGAYGLGLWYGTLIFHKGEIGSGGSIVIAILCVNQASNALLLLYPIYTVMANAKASYASLREVIQRKPRLDPFSDAGVPLDAKYSRIEFLHVDFAYPNRPSIKVLDGLNLSFGAGKTTAIVGPSGAGKSSIVALLERWYDCTRGSVMINGLDISKYNLKSLRTNVRVVEQDAVLFNDTIYNNIVHGLLGTSMNDFPERQKRHLVQKVCMEVQAHDFIRNLPQGYDTVVGIRGSLLSGGQRQRIAIARAIISNPVILVFDEATSALDADSEQLVAAAINRVSRGTTTIIISHRFATIKTADRIILLEGGKVSEEGTHNSLLRTSDSYVRMWMSQNTPPEENHLRISPYPDAAGSFTSRESNTLVGEEGDADDGIPDSTHPSGKTTKRHLTFIQMLASIYKGQRKLQCVLLASATACVFAGLVYPAQAVSIGEAFAAFRHRDNIALVFDCVNFWALMCFVISIGAAVFFFIVGSLSAIGGTLALRSYHEKYFRAILDRAIPFFDKSNHTPGLLAALLSSHSTQISDFVKILNTLGVIVVNLTSTSILALVLSWRFALVAICTGLPLILLASYLRVRSQSRKSKSLTEPLMDSAQYASEVITNIRTVSAFTMETEVCSKMDAKMAASLPTFYKTVFTEMPLFAFALSGGLLGMAISFWYSGHLLVKDQIDPMKLWIVFIGVVSGFDGAGELIANASSIYHAKNAISKINKMTEAASQDSPSQLSAKSSEIPPVDTSITFSNVSFAYDGNPQRPFLKDISFHVPTGKTFAIVGPSGSGKSTIISLLERFYTPTGGGISMGDKIDIGTTNLACYRSKVSLVSQETHLFEGTVRDNILLGVPEDEESEAFMIRAAKDANIHDFIMSLPEGYNTQCGKKGREFSGGQRQRIAIARALVRNPWFLLLDEATSALDVDNQLEVKKALSRATQGRTTISVAHWLSSIRDADRILVLASGRIVEEGSHDELMQFRGVYWGMWQRQHSHGA